MSLKSNANVVRFYSDKSERSGDVEELLQNSGIRFVKVVLPPAAGRGPFVEYRGYAYRGYAEIATAVCSAVARNGIAKPRADS